MMIKRAAALLLAILVLITGDPGWCAQSLGTDPALRPSSELVIDATVLEIDSLVLPELQITAGSKSVATGFTAAISDKVVQSLLSSSGVRRVQQLHVTATFGKLTQMHVGSRLPVRAAATPTKSPAGALVQDDHLDAGIDFYLNPSILSSGEVMMKISGRVQIRRADSSRGPTQTVFTGHSVQNELRITGGQTIAVGGFLTDSEAASLVKIAVLENSALLGYTLSRDRDAKQKREIVVLLAPHIEVLNPIPAGASAVDAVPAPASRPSAPNAEIAASADATGTGTPTTYSVQVGAFQRENAAQDLHRRLMGRYKDVFIQTESTDSLYRVRIGRLASLADAKKLERALRAQGFKPIVVTLN